MPQHGILTYLFLRDVGRDNSGFHQEDDGNDGKGESGVPTESFREEERNMIHGLDDVHMEYHFGSDLHDSCSGANS